MLATLCIATFLVTSTGTALAPFLLDIARDLQAELAAVANLIALTSVSWGATSLVAGAASDRLGRKPVLIVGLLAIGGSTLGVALSGNYPTVAAFQLLAGIGGGAYMGTVFATVSDGVAASQRGRALGWIITGQSLSLVLGVPLVTFIGSLSSWRGALVAQSAATALAAGAVWLVVPRLAERRAERPASAATIFKALNRRVVALLAAGTMERACFASLAVYMATYLLTSYAISLQELAIGLALVALGNLVGNIVGSQLTDRLPARPLFFAASSATTAILALPLLLWQPRIDFSIGLGFAYALSNALGRPALLAALSEVPGEARGAVLGLNITCASFGWLGAAALGGWLITGFGFGGLGIFSAATGLLGAGLATASWLSARHSIK
jgi:MFS transporter, DHA1 family, inner membrane transport protein